METTTPNTDEAIDTIIDRHEEDIKAYEGIVSVLDLRDDYNPRTVAREAIKALIAEAQKPLLELLEDFIWENDDCQYDHNNLCQQHNLDERPCAHERAKALLTKPQEALGDDKL